MPETPKAGGEQIDFEPLYAAPPPLFRISMDGVRGLLDYAVSEAVSETAGSVSSRLRVAEIAADVGYGSPAAFQRAFKRQFGQTPAVYRKRRQAPAATAIRP